MPPVARLKKEMSEFKSDPPRHPVVEFDLVSDNILEWKILVRTPTNSLYDGGLITLFITLYDYPSKPPTVEVKSPIYHLNVNSKTGAICMGLLTENQWTQGFKIADVLDTFFTLLSQPELDSAQDDDVLEQYNNSRDEYNSQASNSAKNCTREQFENLQ